jgi:superfamily I DNA/RNA helicase/mRNA-degrading endonuclease RelE of RelBE toxin-antitoxin system
MEFRIANTFTESLNKLTNQEQKAVKNTAFDLQLNPASPGMQLHSLAKSKDPSFWSVRVNQDIRLIVHKTRKSLLLCYVDHHDKAYQWAERRKLETHPTTGAAQLVEIRERVKEYAIPRYIGSDTASPSKSGLLSHVSETILLGYGVPPEWLNDVRKADDDSLLQLIDHLPEEAAEALLELATGSKPEEKYVLPTGIDPFNHPDAQRRFRIMEDLETLERALNYPWEKWSIFLHPNQRQMVERAYNGAVRVSGSAGTGKTIVALHRAVFLARRNPDARVLLTTFSEPLANALKNKLKCLISSTPRLGERLEVYALDEIGQRLYEMNFGSIRMVDRHMIRNLLQTAYESASTQPETPKFTLPFLLAEWEQVVDPWHLENWEAYRDVIRLGRKMRLPEQRRAILWSIFDQVRSDLNKQKLITHSTMFSRLATQLTHANHRPFDFIIVDEAQDVSIAQLRFLAALGSEKADSLFFAGDLGQRIFQQPFSWKALGVDIRGRSRTLKINYRTSHQIRNQADLLLGPELSDVDGNKEDRRGTISVFNGPKPVIKVLDDPEKELSFVSQWLCDRIESGVKPHEIGVFVRSENEFERANAAIVKSGQSVQILDEKVLTLEGYISICTMHLAKGLEFRTAVVMACDDEIIPSQQRIETSTDDSDLEEFYNTERRLLYVAVTRARDHLLVTGVEPASEFLDDLQM